MKKSKTSNFNPNWASPPGDTIKRILKQKKISIESFVNLIGYDIEYVQGLLQGKIKINYSTARKLQDILGSSKSFWINRENNYRQSLKKLEKW